MSRKNIRQFQNITNGDMSAASITSAVTNIQFADNIGIQLEWSGAPVGTFAIQVSADYEADYLGNVVNAGNWVAIDITPSPSTGAGSPIFLDLNQLSAPFMRIVYTKVSGTGTLQGWIVSKQL